MLKLRLRGETWHLRGTVRVGKEIARIEGESTGFDRSQKADAEIYRTRREHEIQQDLLHGRAGRARRLTIADAIAAYLDRPAVIARRDLQILKAVVAEIGDWRLDEASAAWGYYAARHLTGRRPSTARRIRGTIMAALNYFAELEDIAIRPLPAIRKAKGEEIVAWLSTAERDRLLASYTAPARPIAIFMCFQGTRAQETLQLRWEQVDLAARTAYIAESKNHKGRTVPLHPRVIEALTELRRARPEAAGPVFLTRWGKPYPDRRIDGRAGTNPFRGAHKGALTRAGIKGFRVHDWRHHWAISMLRAGNDVETVRKQGGWESLAAMQRYLATALDEHHHEAVRRVR